MKIYHQLKYYLLVCGLILAGNTSLHAQTPRPDSGRVFSLKDLEGLVLLNNPIFKQAGLLSASARMQVMQSLGKFDPKLESAFGRKEFGNTDYYNNWFNELKVPLWLAGADLKITHDRSVGTYINPQYRTGDEGLNGIGLSVPLGQGLLIDARRNTLRQAKIMVRYAEAEQVKQIITLWYDAVKDYWQWYNTYIQYELLRDGVDLAAKRYEAVVRQTLIGDKPGIDSVEAGITVQERQIQLAKLTQELQNARLLLSNHIWGANDTPMELPENAVPQPVDERLTVMNQPVLDSLINRAAAQHPELVKLRSKSDQLVVERSFRREMLKPTLNLTGALVSSRNTFGAYDPKYYDFRWQNYKVGVDFSIPIFLRYERGKLREVELKQQEVGFDLQQTSRVIKNDIVTYYNTLVAYRDQLSLQVSSISNQQRLLEAEQDKFELGESTLFLINSRETKLIDMQIKRAEMIANFQKTLAGLYYKAGTRQ